MNISMLMTRNVIKIKETASIRQVLKLFGEHGISSAPVVNSRNEAIGFISTRDMMRYIGKHKPILFPAPSWHIFNQRIVWLDQIDLKHKIRHLIRCNVMDVASRQLTIIPEHTPVEKVAAMLGEDHVDHILVGHGKSVTGIVGRNDVIEYLYRFSGTLVPSSASDKSGSGYFKGNQGMAVNESGSF
ncbi:CBS domain-containing protein [Paenibacillus pinihumi]|uniref:CBS domain-containing protein n=1 Tax=Paenibacillus pinihumi TaxID=669462 RepID=UPI0003FFCC61|nr:CBS domain-containing protein [Paenibacillus pinihumi]